MSSFFSQKCKNCFTPLNPGGMQCPSCRQWQNSSSSDTTTSKLIALSELKTSEHSRITSGPWDKCFGGGLVTTSLTLIGGARGAGKSTLSMQIADAICAIYAKEEGRCVYISTEEQPDELQLRGSRLELEYMHRIDVLPSLTSFIESDILNHITSFIKKPKALFFDSFTGAVGDNREFARELSDTLKIVAVKGNFPVIVIDQLTKDNELAGPAFIQHKVDSVLALQLDGTTRRMHTLKNRFGPAPCISEYEMNTFGRLEHVADCKECKQPPSECECE